MQSLSLSTPRRDPIARLALLALVGLVAYLATIQPAPETAKADAVIIVPTQALPTAAPTALSVPTAAPVVQAAPPTFAVPTAEPPPPIVQQIIVEQPVIVERVEQQIVVATPTAAPPPEPAAAPIQIIATAEQGIAMPSGAIVIVPPTPGPGDEGFAESFEDPNKAATCAFVGCLP